MAKMRIKFLNSLDAGCPVSQDEMERYVEEVRTFLEAQYPEAEIVCESTNGQTRVHRDGHQDHDLEDSVQSIWEAGNFWD